MNRSVASSILFLKFGLYLLGVGDAFILKNNDVLNSNALNIRIDPNQSVSISNPDGTHLCDGEPVGKNVIMALASCVANLNPDNIRIKYYGTGTSAFKAPSSARVKKVLVNDLPFSPPDLGSDKIVFLTLADSYDPPSLSDAIFGMNPGLVGSSNHETRSPPTYLSRRAFRGFQSSRVKPVNAAAKHAKSKSLSIEGNVLMQKGVEYAPEARGVIKQTQEGHNTQTLDLSNVDAERIKGVSAPGLQTLSVQGKDRGGSNSPTDDSQPADDSQSSDDAQSADDSSSAQGSDDSNSDNSINTSNDEQSQSNPVGVNINFNGEQYRPSQPNSQASSPSGTASSSGGNANNISMNPVFQQTVVNQVPSSGTANKPPSEQAPSAPEAPNSPASPSPPATPNLPSNSTASPSPSSSPSSISTTTPSSDASPKQDKKPSTNESPALPSSGGNTNTITMSPVFSQTLISQAPYNNNNNNGNNNSNEPTSSNSNSENSSKPDKKTSSPPETAPMEPSNGNNQGSAATRGPTPIPSVEQILADINSHIANSNAMFEKTIAEMQRKNSWSFPIPSIQNIQKVNIDPSFFTDSYSTPRRFKSRTRRNSRHKTPNN